MSPVLMPIAMTVIIFSQNFGGTLFLSFAQTTFSAGLLNALPKFAPGVLAKSVVDAGATGFREMVTAKDLVGVVKAFNEAVNHVFWVITGCSVLVFCFSWGIGWKSIKKAKLTTAEAP